MIKGKMFNSKPYIIRKEPFGFTFYIRSTLKHLFFSPVELDLYLNKNKINRSDCDYLQYDNQVRKEIIYSPIRIYYELTLACNLHCRFCFNSSGTPRSNELSTGEVIQSLHYLRKINVIDIRFTGGELTCRPDWYEILFEAKRLGFVVSCNTNANFFDSSFSQKIASLDLDQVTTSIDGVKEHHEINRGANSYDRAISNIQKMFELGVKLRINTLLNKYSVGDLEPMVKLASLYTKEINFFTIVFIGRGANLESKYAISEKENLQLAKEADKLRNKYPNLNIMYFAQATRENSIDLKTSKKFRLKLGSPPGFTNLNLSSDGEIWCGGYVPYIDPSLSLGNIKDNNLLEIWQNSQKLEKIRNSEGKLKNFCDHCPEYVRKQCQGSKYETELYRLNNPGTKNPCCIHSNELSLLEVMNR